MSVTTADLLLNRPVHVNVERIQLEGNLVVPQNAAGMVVFAHGSGSSRHSPRNRFVAGALHDAGFATLLLDLLTVQEESEDMMTSEYRFDIARLAQRVVGATDWLSEQDTVSHLPIGYFGASTGAGAALVAATRRADRVRAVVSRGGRPDLASDDLPNVKSPTLLIVGGDDTVVIDLNRQAMARMSAAEKELHIVPRASHLFEEPGALQEVARLASHWFSCHMTRGEVGHP